MLLRLSNEDNHFCNKDATDWAPRQLGEGRLQQMSTEHSIASVNDWPPS